MELTVLGSNSSGNCYVLQNGTEALVIEAGVPFMEVKKAVGFEVSKIQGVLISHEHGDHAKYVNQYLDAHVDVMASNGTLDALIEKIKSKQKPMILEPVNKVVVTVGNFKVLPFGVKHDAAEPLGFFIHHPETGNVLFATDTYYLPYTFSNLNNIIIECNYRDDILRRNIEAGRVPKLLQDRTLESHMSFKTCKETLQANDLKHVNNIVLIHLSDQNSNAVEFKNDIHAVTGKTVYIAEKGLKMNLNATPF